MTSWNQWTPRWTPQWTDPSRLNHSFPFVNFWMSLIPWRIWIRGSVDPRIHLIGTNGSMIYWRTFQRTCRRTTFQRTCRLLLSVTCRLTTFLLCVTWIVARRVGPAEGGSFFWFGRVNPRLSIWQKIVLVFGRTFYRCGRTFKRQLMNKMRQCFDTFFFIYCHVTWCVIKLQF